ncbi:MAG: hypothetical protein GY845_03285 [Planctomycetes bacterium]|nr:hypothetical protein [Planctomycetota bacterium]
MKKVISTRLSSDSIAKARDGLELQGYEAEQLATASNIVRLTFLHGLASIVDNPDSPASAESQSWIDQRVGQNRRKKNLSLQDIINGNERSRS